MKKLFALPIQRCQKKAVCLMAGSLKMNISIKTARGKKLNCFGMINRNNDFVFETTYETIDSKFIVEQINNFSKVITKHTVIVSDNTKVHQSKLLNK